jgi:hypothetical protein
MRAGMVKFDTESGTNFAGTTERSYTAQRRWHTTHRAKILSVSGMGSECLPPLGKVNTHVGAAQDSVPMVRCVKRKAVPLHVIASSIHTAMLTLCEALQKNQIREEVQK